MFKKVSDFRSFGSWNANLWGHYCLWQYIWHHNFSNAMLLDMGCSTCIKTSHLVILPLNGGRGGHYQTCLVTVNYHISRNRGNKRRILEAVTDLALIGRGLAGTDYGAQTRGFHWERMAAIPAAPIFTSGKVINTSVPYVIITRFLCI